MQRRSIPADDADGRVPGSRPLRGRLPFSGTVPASTASAQNPRPSSHRPPLWKPLPFVPACRQPELSPSLQPGIDSPSFLSFSPDRLYRHERMSGGDATDVRPARGRVLRRERSHPGRRLGAGAGPANLRAGWDSDRCSSDRALHGQQHLFEVHRILGRVGVAEGPEIPSDHGPLQNEGHHPHEVGAWARYRRRQRRRPIRHALCRFHGGLDGVHGHGIAAAPRLLSSAAIPVSPTSNVAAQRMDRPPRTMRTVRSRSPAPGGRPSPRGQSPANTVSGAGRMGRRPIVRGCWPWASP
jgi:hypothetical protein